MRRKKAQRVSAWQLILFIDGLTGNPKTNLGNLMKAHPFCVVTSELALPCVHAHSRQQKCFLLHVLKKDGGLEPL